MKKHFIEPKIEVKKFAEENVVTTSVLTGNQADNGSVSPETHQILTLDVVNDLGFDLTF